MKRLPRDQLLLELKEKIANLQGARRRSAATVVVSTGLGELDRLFPERGLSAGTLTEWLAGEEGSGAATLCLFLAARLQERGGAVVVIDERREFYPPAARALGIVLPRTIVVRPRQARDGWWAWEQALRSPATAAAVGWIGPAHDRVFRRLQLAAEAGGGVGFLLRPACRRQPSWAQAKFLVEARPSDMMVSSLHRRLRVSTADSSQSVELELNDETNVVRLVPSLAHPALTARSAGA